MEINVITPNRNAVITQAFTSYKSEVYAIFRQVCIPEDKCEDLVQDVFVKLMKVDVLQENLMKGLVVTIAYHLRTDYLRHRAYLMNREINEVPENMMEYSHADDLTDAHEIEKAEMRVVECMSQLDCQTYSMSRFDDMSTDEIASALQISDRAVEARLYRTRRMVRENVRKVINL